MAINISDPISVPLAEDAWVDFLLKDTSGNPLPGVNLSTVLLWYLRPNDNTLETKLLSPGINLQEVGAGVYSVLFTADELDKVGVFAFVVEATGASQGFKNFYVIAEDGVEGGVAVNSESWLPWRAISGNAASGSAGLTPATVYYKKAGGASFSTKALTLVDDLRDLGRGLYSIRFTTDELDTLGPFTYNVLTLTVDPFLFFGDVVSGTADKFVFTVLEQSLPIANITLQIRDADTYALLGSVVSGTSGKATVYLTRGTYIVTLVFGTTVFDRNNIPFEVHEQASLNEMSLDAAGLTPVTVPTTTMVTGSAEVRNASNEPLEDVLITVVMRKPTAVGGVLYMGTQELLTGPDGKVSKEFEPGLLLQVSVQGTRMIREYEVPVVDFNLITAALGVADPLTIQTPTYPVAPSHVP